MKDQDSNIKVFALNSNPELAKEIVDLLGIKMSTNSIKRFSDGEIQLNIEESIRGCDTYLVQSIARSGNEYIMELLIMIDALKRASANTINVVLPYYGYARQDRKLGARQPITAKLIADLLETAGATRVITIDLHSSSIEGFFDIPVDQLSGIQTLSAYFKEKNLSDVVVVAPDNSGALRARKMASFLDVPIAFMDRRTYNPEEPKTVNVIGEVEGKTAIIIDDMVDTGENLLLTTNVLIEHGVKEVYGCFTHAVLSGSSIEKIARSTIKELVVTNTIALPETNHGEKIKVLSIAPLLTEAIQRTQNKFHSQ
ncbi:ribose-phosphate pyrophosphokinase [Bacillus fengqiuensis]|nr:ribose-phosphate pyrophosphokinase [Bacillus fengqiuensis]